MPAPKWALLTVPVLVACAMTLACGPQDAQPPDQADTVRAYQPRFEEVRRKLVQVKTLLPAARVGAESCDIKAPLDPQLRYRTEGGGKADRTESNTEIVMERALPDPDVLPHYLKTFEYGGTDLLDSLRWTGPRGTLGENRFELHPPPGHWSESYDRELRVKLDHGLNTRYVVVLRVVEYGPPASGDRVTTIGYFSNVVLDGFIVDLRQLKLLCRFTADGKFSGLAVINIRPGQAWSGRVYEDLQESTGYAIVKKLESLTGGTADPPQRMTGQGN